MQLKHTVNYRNTEEEKELFEWIEEKGKIIKPANYIKQIMYEKMLEERKNVKE